MDKRFTEGICGDGAAILDNGKLMTVTEILKSLNRLDELERFFCCKNQIGQICSEQCLGCFQFANK